VKSILILEDDFELAMYWRMALEERGYSVSQHSTVDSAITAIDGAKAIDLVITDLLITDGANRYSNRGGLSLLSHIELRSKNPPKRIAISGARPQIKALETAAQLKADRTLQKPVDVDELVGIVEEMIGR
jgi:DNA-binding NtrC family response regulator